MKLKAIIEPYEKLRVLIFDADQPIRWMEKERRWETDEEPIIVMSLLSFEEMFGRLSPGTNECMYLQTEMTGSIVK